MHDNFLGYMSNQLTVQKFKEFGLWLVREEVYHHYKGPYFKDLSSLNNSLLSFINSLIIYFNTQNIQNDFESVNKQILKIMSLKEEYIKLGEIYFNNNLFPSVDLLTKKIVEARRLIKNGLPISNHFIPSGYENNLQKSIIDYKNKLAQYIKDPKYKVVLFAGIGKGPAHIAFNDFVEEDFISDFNKTEEEKTFLAKTKGTRKVKLTYETRSANARFFKNGIIDVPTEAITIGFKEILQVDKIFVLVTGASKIKSLYETFNIDKPSYKVPASLLRFFDKKVDFLIDKKAYGSLDKNINSLYRLHYRAKQEKSIEYQKKTIKNKSILDIKSDASINFIINYEGQDQSSNFVNHYSFPSNMKVFIIKDRNFPVVLESELVKSKNIIYKENKKSFSLKTISPFSLVVLPIDLFYSLKKDHRSSMLGKTFIAYQGEVSLFNIHEKITKNELNKKSLSLSNFHFSQVYRTPFGEIVREMSYYNKSVKNIDNLIEEYSYSERHNSLKTLSDKKNLSDKIKDGDTLFIVAPHPDDAEIGTGGLLQKLSSKALDIHVLIATSGYKALIKKSIFFDSQFYSKDLLDSISNERGTYLLNNKLKEKVRLEETEKALKFLNSSVKIHFVDLPFYKHQKNYSSNDVGIATKFLKENIKLSEKNGDTFVLLPHFIDKHKTHRVTTEIFSQSIRNLTKDISQFNPYVLYYQTPWTGEWNFYHYHQTIGSKFIALVGLEFLAGNGEESIVYNEKLFPYANRYLIETF